MWEGMLSPPGKCLSPCVLRVSGSCPVLSFRLPQTMSLGLEMIDFPLQDGEAVFIKVWGF